MMSLELIYILTGCAMLGVLYAFTIAGSTRKRKSTEPLIPPRGGTASGIESPIFYSLTLKMEEVFRRLDSIESGDLNALRGTLNSIKKSIADFDSEINLKLRRGGETRGILQSSLVRINRKVDDALRRFENEERRLEAERLSSEQELERLKKESAGAQEQNRVEIMKLTAHLEELKAGLSAVSVQELKKEIEPLFAEAEALSKKYAEAEARLTGTLAAKDNAVKTMAASAAGAVTSAEQQKFKRISDIKSRVEMLEGLVNTLKREILTGQESRRVDAERAAKSIEEAKAYVRQLEEDKKTAGKLIYERELLQEKLQELNAGLEIQERKFSEELAAGDAEIERINTETGRKISEIESAACEEGLKFEAERQSLEAEIGRLRERIDANAAAGRQALDKLQSELNRLEEQRGKKELEYSEVNRERIEKEKKVKDELNRRIDGFRNEVESRIIKFNAAIKAKGDEIYNLKVRLIAREDKLKSDLEKRRATGKLLIEDLHKTSETLRNKYSRENGEINERVKPMLARIEAVKQSLSGMESTLAQERVVLAKLESERRRLAQEIENVQRKIEQDASEAKRLIDLKNRYVVRLSEEIIEKERLFEIERNARQQIIQGKYLVKTEKQR